MWLMRILPSIAALALSAVLAAPIAVAEGFWGGPSARPGIPRTSPGAGARDRPERRAYFGERRARPDRRPHRGHRHRRPFPRYCYFYDDYDDDTRIAPPAPPIAPAPAPVPEVGQTEASPPDPRGESRFVPARGIAAAAPLYRAGEPLPRDLPHVTLHWQQYGLPEPPPGYIYARVGRDVLLIEAATRRVERQIEPDEIAAAGG